MQKVWFSELERAEEFWREDLLKQVFRPDPARDRLRSPELRKALETVREAAPHLDEAALARVLDNCLMGLLHSVHVAIDGGSELAEAGRVSLVDGQGVSLGEGLHELFPIYVDQRRGKRSKRRRARVRDSRAPSSGHRRRRATP